MITRTFASESSEERDSAKAPRIVTTLSNPFPFAQTTTEVRSQRWPVGLGNDSVAFELDFILHSWVSAVFHESFVLFKMLINFGLCEENLEVGMKDCSEASFY